MTTKNRTVFPQEIAIPETLEIHPSIPSDLANEMIAAAELIHSQPHLYNGREPVFARSKCGCILAIVEHRMKVREIRDLYPQHNEALTAIFRESDTAETAKNPAWAIARIEHFLTHGA